VKPVLAVAAPDDRPVPRADTDSSALVFLAVTAGTMFVAADIGFGIYDSVKVAHGLLPARGVSIAEATVAAPQVVALGAGIAVLGAHEERENSPPMGLMILLPGVVNTLFMHGVWGAQTTIARPGVLYGVSAAVGFDTVLLTADLGRASERHFSTRGMGITQMLLTAPQIAASAYGIVRDSGNARGWAALAGGSGALFAHGLVSTIVGGRPPELPNRPPEPPPPPSPPSPTLHVPASIEAAPMPIASGFGVGVRGTWL
jgi:hypothetical protein